MDFVGFIKSKLGRKADSENSAADSLDPVEQAERDLAQHAAKEKVFLKQYEEARSKRVSSENAQSAAAAAELTALKQAEQRALNLLENSRFTTAELVLQYQLAAWRAAGAQKEMLDQIISETQQHANQHQQQEAKTSDAQQKQWHLRHLVHYEQMLTSLQDLR